MTAPVPDSKRPVPDAPCGIDGMNDPKGGGAADGSGPSRKAILGWGASEDEGLSGIMMGFLQAGHVVLLPLWPSSISRVLPQEGHLNSISDIKTSFLGASSPAENRLYCITRRAEVKSTNIALLGLAGPKPLPQARS